MSGLDPSALRPGQVHWREDDNPRIGDDLDNRKSELRGSDPAGWPPIVVALHGDGYLGIDGFARWTVATELALPSIATRIEPMPADVRQRAFELNQHGFPLTLAQRKGHAAYLRERYPERSDRDIARACGLSPTTIGNLHNPPEDRPREQQSAVMRYLRRVAHSNASWESSAEAADQVRAAFDDKDDLDHFVDDLGDSALAALEVAQRLGFDPEAQ